ncbi:ribonuclease R [Prolixibacter sp. NT017]|uniref:ribonuclease R n=1 Tax=Prolixibacter sp. NT017 TaxID=2652390 RepID=UPI0012769283|nr:ribonuclease R [Prolixibacter sp. NT017]GET27287.1 ribonuclease R [Prolixibacter sp. NT017]
MVKKKKKKKLRFNKAGLKKAVLDIFYADPKKTFNYKQLSAELFIRDMPTKKLIHVVLEELRDNENLEEISRGKYKLRSKGGYITGVVELTQQGFGFVISDEIDQDVFVSAANLKRAMHGDKVKVYLYARRKKHNPEGEVVEILERAKTTFVGTVEVSKFHAFLIPTQKTPFDLFIPKEKLNGAKNGQKAIAKILEWPERAKNPYAEIVEVLGDVGENETEMHAILAEFDLPYKFPGKVEKAAEQIPLEIPKEEYANRRDFRKVPTFTIDPADAKDFDDALSVQKLDNGFWEVGVHIADVTHYVQPNSILEEEAYNRATSVYLVDRVVPMLPERLSNGVCSLRPNEDKLCFSAVFQLDDKANVHHRWLGRTVIHSDRRFAYEEAQEVIETGDGDMKEEILTLDRLAKELRNQRFQNGSISFDRIEVKFDIDEDGKPLGIIFKVSKDANKLIEEFMLLANKYVAEFIGKPTPNKKAKTFVYRIHDKPDPDKLDSFNHFIKRFGYGIQTNNPKAVSDSMNKLLTNVEGKKEQNVIETLAIRTMARAEYSTRNIGHYGLSFEYYTHFTSPIRRYPDMMVHRLLARYLDGGRSVVAQKWEEMCKHSSDMEVRASNAERSSVKYKQVEFMSDHVGEEFKGVISGVTDWGIYVELEENKCEGMVPLRDLTDDFYEFDEKNYCIIGSHTHKRYQLGDEVNVEIVRTNLQKKQMDFRLVEDGE